jgi:hypothetical protein
MFTKYNYSQDIVKPALTRVRPRNGNPVREIKPLVGRSDSFHVTLAEQEREDQGGISYTSSKVPQSRRDQISRPPKPFHDKLKDSIRRKDLLKLTDTIVKLAKPSAEKSTDTNSTTTPLTPSGIGANLIDLTSDYNHDLNRLSAIVNEFTPRLTPASVIPALQYTPQSLLDDETEEEQNYTLPTPPPFKRDFFDSDDDEILFNFKRPRYSGERPISSTFMTTPRDTITITPSEKHYIYSPEGISGKLRKSELIDL